MHLIWHPLPGRGGKPQGCHCQHSNCFLVVVFFPECDGVAFTSGGGFRQSSNHGRARNVHGILVPGSVFTRDLTTGLPTIQTSVSDQVVPFLRPRTIAGRCGAQISGSGRRRFQVAAPDRDGRSSMAARNGPGYRCRSAIRFHYIYPIQNHGADPGRLAAS